MARISREADMSVGHIYNYFKSKEEIIAGMCEREMSRVLERFRDMGDCRERFVEGLKDVLRAEIAENADTRLSALFRDLMAEIGRNETITRAMEDFDRRMREELADLCRKHQPGWTDDKTLIRVEMLLLLLQGYCFRGTLHAGIDPQGYLREASLLFEHLLQ